MARESIAPEHLQRARADASGHKAAHHEQLAVGPYRQGDEDAAGQKREGRDPKEHPAHKGDEGAARAANESHDGGAQRSAGKVNPMGRGGGGKDQRRAEAEDDPCPAQAEAENDDEKVQESRVVYGLPSARFTFSDCGLFAIRGLLRRTVRAGAEACGGCGGRGVGAGARGIRRAGSLFGCASNRFARMRGC